MLNGLQLRSISPNCAVISACVLLHNFFISNSTNNDPIELDDELLDDNLNNWINPDPVVDELECDNDDDEDLQPSSVAGKVKRDILCAMLWSRKQS